jgi:hypothetical protein
MKRSGAVPYYLGYIAAWTVAIVAAGALVGAVAFPLVGKLAGSDASVAALAAQGARDLGFLAFIWAPGTAIVAAFHHAWKRHQANAAHLRR